MEREWSALGGGIEVLSGINSYSDLPHPTTISDEGVYYIESGDLSPDYIMPSDWDGSQFTTWRSLFDGKSIA